MPRNRQQAAQQTAQQAAQQTADAVATELKAFPGVTTVSPPQLDTAHTAALIDVVPATAPSDPATAALVTAIRDQAPAIARATSSPSPEGTRGISPAGSAACCPASI